MRDDVQVAGHLTEVEGELARAQAVEVEPSRQLENVAPLDSDMRHCRLRAKPWGSG